MKFGKKKRKQGLQPSAQALSDDDLMDVVGGIVYWKYVTDENGKQRKWFWAEDNFGRQLSKGSYKKRHATWAAFKHCASLSTEQWGKK